MYIVGPMPRTPRGYRSILTSMCMYTKYLEALPLRKVNTESVAEAMLEIFHDMVFQIPS